MIYQESENGRFTHNGNKYLLNKLFKLVDKYPIQFLPISRLTWILKYSQKRFKGKIICYSCRKGPIGWHEERIKECNIDIPIVVTKSGEKLVVLDGVHRLEKAIKQKVNSIPAKVIDEKLLEKCLDIEENHITLSDGRKLAYKEYGFHNGKKVLFYFHGWPGSRLSGLETDEAAKKLKIKVISVDRPGFGGSDYKSDRKLLDWPDDVVELADKLKIKKFSIMGVSGGGPYVAVCAYKIPERINKAGIVVGLAPVDVNGNLNGMSFLSKISWANYHRLPIARTIAGVNGLLGYKYFPKLSLMIGFGAKEDQELIKKKFGKRIDNSVKEAFKNGIKGPVHDLKIYTDSWGFKLKDIKAKVYLWYGAKDRNVSLNMGKYYSSQIKGSKLFIEQHGGHLFRNNIEEKIIKTLTS